MKEASKQSSRCSVSSEHSTGEIGEQAKRLLRYLALDTNEDEKYPSEFFEELGVDPLAMKTIISLNDKAAVRKKAKLLTSLDDSKSRIVYALKGCDEEDNIPWGPNDDPAEIIQRGNQHDSIIAALINPEMTDAMKTKKERSRLIAHIESYVKLCKARLTDLHELIEWAANLSFDLKWDDVGVSSVKKRYEEEYESYCEMNNAMEKAWQCTYKIQGLVEQLSTNNTYDSVSSRLPPHILAGRKKRGIYGKNLWSSPKLRLNLDEYNNMRKNVEEQKSNKPGARQKTEKRLGGSVGVTVKPPGKELEGNITPYKEVESTILREINSGLKDAIIDVHMYMQEVKIHRFSKKSCKVKLDKASLMLEFITAAMEGRELQADQINNELTDTKVRVARLQDETHALNWKLSEAYKATHTAQKKISKLKRQLESMTKSNEVLQDKISDMEDKIENLTKELEELQDLPSQQEYEECLEKIEALEHELNDVDTTVSLMKSEIEDRDMECQAVKELLILEKEENATLRDDIGTLKSENADMRQKLSEAEKKLSQQEQMVTSLRLMVVHKEKMVRSMKQAAIDLQTNENTKKAPKKPPPSPEENSRDMPEKERRPISIRTTNDKMVQVATGPEGDLETSESMEEIPVEVIDGKVVKKQNTPGVKKRALSAQRPDVVARLYPGVKLKESAAKVTTVTVFSKDYEQLEEKHRQALREIDAAKRELEKAKYKFELQLREGLETERNKSILESMKNEENLQHLSFTVKDETMRIRKEMRKFVGNFSHVLREVMGYKGQITNTMLPNTGGRDEGGLTTNVNLQYASQNELDSYMNDGTFDSMLPKDLMIGDLSQQDFASMNLFAEEMDRQGIPYDNDFKEMMTNLPLNAMQRTDNSSKSEDRNQSARLVHSAAADEKRKEVAVEEIKNDEKVVELPTTSEERRKTAESEDNSRDKINRMSKTTIDAKLRSLGVSLRPRRALDLNKKEKPDPNTETEILLKSPDGESSQQQNIEKDKTWLQENNSSPVEGSEPLEMTAAIPRHRSEQTRSSIAQGHEVVRRESRDRDMLPVQIVNIVAQSDARASNHVITDGDGIERVGNFAHRRRARLAGRSDSVSIPHRLSILALEARAENYNENRKKGAAKIRDSRLHQLAKLRMRRHPEPIEQAEKFVRIISYQVGDFLSNMEQRLSDLMMKNKKRMEGKIEAVENEMLQLKLRHICEIEDLKKENAEKEKEIKSFKKSNGNVVNSEVLPKDLFLKLTQAEDDLDAAKKRLDRAAEKHLRSANQYRNMSRSLGDELKTTKDENKRMKYKIQKEIQKTKESKIQIQNIQKSRNEKLFLSLRQHKHNYRRIEKIEDTDVKKVALNLLKRSMLYPEESLRLLIQQYCQHVRFANCQERVRKQLVEEEQKTVSENLMKGRPTQNKKALLTNFLAGLAVRNELAKNRIAEKRKKLQADRQKLLMKASLVMQRLSNENQDLDLSMPIGFTVYGKTCRPAHREAAPVLRRIPKLQGFLPRTTPLPEILSSKSEIMKTEDLAPITTKPPIDRPEQMSPIGTYWFPDESEFCPFSESGNINSNNADAFLEYVDKKDSRASSYSSILPRPEMPRIIELEVQSGLREARKMVMKRLCSGKSYFGSTLSKSSMQHLPTSGREYNGPDKPPTYAEATNSKYNDILTSFRRNGLPPLPSPPKNMKVKNKNNVTDAVAVDPVDTTLVSSTSNVHQTRSSLSTPSMRSSSNTTPGFPID